MKTLLLISILLLCAVSFTYAEDQADILGKILSEVGFDRTDLGYQPKGYWNRFPTDIPHKLSSFDDLFAEPLKLYDYARVMSNTVELYLDPNYSDSAADGLYKLLYNLGVDKKLGGFRSYSANLLPAPNGDQPLTDAIDLLYQTAGRSTEFYTFGKKSEWPNYKEDIAAQAELLPDSVRTIIAKLIVNLNDAIRWRNLAFRNCDPEIMRRTFDIRDLADTQTDGMVYYSELDDIAATIDLPSLHYAALKTAAASEEAAAALKPWMYKLQRDLKFEVATPYGRIVIFGNDNSKPGALDIVRSPLSSTMHLIFPFDATNTLLVIDFGRWMSYSGTPGATASLSNPISVLIDLGGDDTYGSDSSRQPSAGVGILGVGLLIDENGSDSYRGFILTQGAGLFGVGVLLDRNGNDSYKATLSAQGCGYFGIGLCLDGSGDDDYYLVGDGQGFGGVGGGIGVCASFSGDDKYTAEPFTKNYNRGDYHSENKINGNGAQGAGFGRRGDGSDGHSWAGGLGAIIDINGNDHYFSGNWTLGVGYWFATGIAVDRSGDDIYESCYFTQGSGAHYCNGILLDEGGDDKHELFETAGAALGFGWDFTNALLINKGGNDSYKAKMISMGLAQIRSCALLIDIGGDDSYSLGEGTPGLGEATFRKDYKTPSKLTPYYIYAKSFGGFIDIGGSDSYYSFKDDNKKAHPVAKSSSLWLTPNRADSTFGANNYGVGIDTETGTIPELFKWSD